LSKDGGFGKGAKDGGFGGSEGLKLIFQVPK